MGKPFRLDDSDPKSRLQRLSPPQAEALESVLRSLGKAWDGPSGAAFLLPLAEAGFPAALMGRLAEKLPPGWPLDHRELYFDFRLDRWIRHLEPPTLAECLDEYVRTAPNPGEGLEYAKKEWEAFLARWRKATSEDGI
ncbi:MAG: hypothetical protein JF616_17185 [Fibrobacteres bacterium]|nr:hypothetical protein [Fibrobacterota bacterium]